MKSCPLDFSPKAWVHVQASIAREKSAKGIQINLEVSGCNGYQITLEVIHEQPDGYLLIHHQGCDLFIDPEVYERVCGTRVEINDLGFGQSKLVFVHPKATHVCGCGESFTLPDSEVLNG